MHPRWFSLNELTSGRVDFKGANQILLDKKVNEITEVSTATPLTLFNGTEGDGTNAVFKLPGPRLRTSSRYRDSSRLAKIMTSNAAKLPPLGRLNPQFADKICENYFVQVGIANDNGSFLAESPIQAKRSLRRNESITASFWPDHFNNADIVELEQTANSGSCNTAYQTNTTDGVGRGNLMSNRIAVNTPLLLDTPYITGSSRFNGPNSNLTAHSQNCISRFGVQDIVGNQSESNSEYIFCDYTQDQIRLGPVTSAWQGGQSIVNTDKFADPSEPFVVHLPFFNTQSQREYWAVSKDFQFKYRDGVTSPRSADIKPWVKITPNSGYCSLVDDNPEKRIGDEDFFKDLATGFWTSIKLASGAVNPAIIEKSQPDQMAVNEWRNGDGRFLDFGPQGISPALNRASTLDLRNVSLGGGTGKYFNPLIGLPLLCSSGSCNDSQLSSPNDNTSITTSLLNPNIDPDSAINDLPTLTNFPIGNSQITNPGITDFRFPAAGYEEYTVPIGGGVNSAPFRDILTAVTFDTPGSPAGATITSKTIYDYSPGETIQYYKVIWDVPRGTIFRMNYGGSSKNTYSGRYSSSFAYQFPNTSNNGSGTNEVNSGARCTVMINQEP
jgi:hypothetical protein